jgi:hypothetical protein
MKYILTLLSLALVLCGGCASTKLDPTGPYKGNTALYDADQVIDTAYDTLHAFVAFEKSSEAALASRPEIHAAAERIRSGAKQWFSSAIALRDAYAKDPTPENQSAMTSAVNVIKAALVEAAKYQAPPKTAAALPLVPYLPFPAPPAVPAYTLLSYAA